MEKARLNTKLLSTLNSVLYMSAAELREAAGIARSTWYDIMGKPGEITVQYLLALANGLHIPVRRFFSMGRADVVGMRDDYITEPYEPCSYNGNVLSETVRCRQDATWKLAAEMTGMSYQRLQRSLLTETRLPVERFLTVCEAFDIDPFTVLIDPNPEPKARKGGDAKLLEEIRTLRKDIAALSDTVSSLTEKYQNLLDAHQRLTTRLNDHVDGITVAAEPEQ